MTVNMTTFHTYMLLCSDGSYYIGHTDDLEKRLSQHAQGTYDGHTKGRLPLKLVYCEAYGSRDDAFARERQLKGWSRAKKSALIRQDWPAIIRLSQSMVRLRGLIFDDWGTDLGRDQEVALREPRGERPPNPLGAKFRIGRSIAFDTPPFRKSALSARPEALEGRGGRDNLSYQGQANV
jgi:predicted GIY-YIG superfamily endonuclease